MKVNQLSVTFNKSQRAADSLFSPQPISVSSTQRGIQIKISLKEGADIGSDISRCWNHIVREKVKSVHCSLKPRGIKKKITAWPNTNRGK